MPAAPPTPPAARPLAPQLSGGEQAVVLLSLAWLLVGPRVELPLAPGLRVEDLALALLAVLCARHALPLSRPSGPTAAVLAVAATGVVAAVAAAAAGTLSPTIALLYALRPLEYWIVFPAVRLLLTSSGGEGTRRADLLLAGATVLQAAFAAAQYFLSWEVGFSHAAYTRAAGLTVGPYELGAIGAALTVHWLSRRRPVLAAAAALALALSISRVSILGAAVGTALLIGATSVLRLRRGGRGTAPVPTRLLRSGRLHLMRTGVVAGAASLALGFVLGFCASPAGGAAVQRATAPVVERFATTSVLGSWVAADALAERVPTVRTAGEYQDAAYTRLPEYVQTGHPGAEASNLIRFFRWHLILDTVDEPREVVLGLGASFVGPSVDGSYLRFFADGGLLGAAAWVMLIVMWLRRTPLGMTCTTATLLVGAVFIDILYAQRPMSLYWALLALALHGVREAPHGGRHRAPVPPVRPLGRTGRRRAGAAA